MKNKGVKERKERRKDLQIWETRKFKNKKKERNKKRKKERKKRKDVKL